MSAEYNFRNAIKADTTQQFQPVVVCAIEFVEESLHSYSTSSFISISFNNPSGNQKATQLNTAQLTTAQTRIPLIKFNYLKSITPINNKVAR